MKYYDRSAGFEDFLERLNDAVLGSFPPDAAAIGGTDVQIFGLPRSGTTVLYQLFARTGGVGYPSNLMAMFWRAPWVGAQLQAQLAKNDPSRSLDSLAGRTREPLDPHEFGYFWRRALGHSRNSFAHDLQRLDEAQLAQQLAMIHDVLDAPVVYKNFLVPPHIEWLRNALPMMRYIFVQRPVLDVAASLLTVRRKIGVADHDDFGPLPAGWRPARNESVHRRIGRQVSGLSEQVERALAAPEPDLTVVPYSALCEDTRGVMASLLGWLDVDVNDQMLERLPDRLPLATSSDQEERARLGEVLSEFMEVPQNR